MDEQISSAGTDKVNSAVTNGKKTSQVGYITGVTLTVVFILYFVEQSIGVNYGVKTLIKILLFTGIPVIYIKFVEKVSISEALKLNSFRKNNVKVGLTAGLLFCTIVLGAYFLLQGEIDLGKIAAELQGKLKVTPLNFIFVGIYITFGNSFLEEFFFRGFIFLNLYKLGLKKLSYIYSSLLFGIYHIAIFKTWFTLPLTLLALFGLFSVGFLFDWMDTKSDNFINSWISHAFADSAIILIGMRMFGIL